MDNLLISLMNCGFVIYRSKNFFVVSKIETPADSRKMPDVEFTDIAQALDHAKLSINWKDTVPAVRQMIDASWRLQLMYRHRGLGVRFNDLGEMGSVPYDIALEEATIRGKSYIDKSYAEGDIETWEVKVSPQSKNYISKL